MTGITTRILDFFEAEITFEGPWIPFAYGAFAILGLWAYMKISEMDQQQLEERRSNLENTSAVELWNSEEIRRFKCELLVEQNAVFNSNVMIPSRGIRLLDSDEEDEVAYLRECVRLQVYRKEIPPIERMVKEDAELTDSELDADSDEEYYLGHIIGKEDIREPLKMCSANKSIESLAAHPTTHHITEDIEDDL